MMYDVWQVGETLESAEKEIIKKALQFYGGNKTMTAASLGISLRGLDGKMKRFNFNTQEVLEDAKENKTAKTESKNRRGRPKKDSKAA